VPDAPRVLAACGMPFEAAIADGPGVVAVCGPGPWRVAQRLHRMLDGSVRWSGIISFGCAGGLDPDLASGDCVVAIRVLTPGGIVATDPGWSRALLDLLPGARPGLLAGVDAPLATAAAKAALWRDAGAAAVDMETHAAALAARRHGLPFAACRIVLDPAARDVPTAALAGLEGGAWPVLRALAGAPGQLASLCALARDAWVARRALRQARDRLGPALGCYLPPSSLPPSSLP
jgi:hopanoid-associated phosphorylase